MAYTLNLTFDFGSLTGLTLNGILFDAAGVQTGSTITSGFVELGQGVYSYLATLPDSHVGTFIAFKSTDATIKAAVSINPQEAEYTDAKTSTRSTYAGGDTSGTTTLLSRVTGAVLLAADYTAPLSAAGTRSAVGLASANLDTQLATIAGYIDTEIATLITSVGAGLNTLVTAVKAKTDNLPAAPAAVGDIPTTAQVADKILGRSLAGAADGGRTVQDALRASRNKVAFNVPATGQFTVYTEDDTTPAWTGTFTTTAGAAPVRGVDPA